MPTNSATLRHRAPLCAIGTLALLCALAAPQVQATSNCDGNSGTPGGNSSAVICGNGNTLNGDGQSVVFGSGNYLSGIGSTALGIASGGTGNYSTAIGRLATVNGDSSIAIGGAGNNYSEFTAVDANGAIGIGKGVLIYNGADDSIALGTYSRIYKNVSGAVALGAGAEATESNTVSIGAAGNERRIVNVAAGMAATDAVNRGQMDAAITDTRIFTTNATNAAETNAKSYTDTKAAATLHDAKTFATTAANTAQANAINAANSYTDTQVATVTASASNAQTTANTALANAATAQGAAFAAQTDATAALANIQSAVNQLLQSGVCSMTSGTVSCGGAVQLGNASTASGANAVAVGNGASATYDGAVAIGDGATITAPTGGGPTAGAVAIGRGARANADPSVAIGNFADATGADAVAVGDSSTATGNQAVALGYQAVATHANSVALGAGSQTSAADTVSVGRAGANRRITNVATPVEADDAATKGYVDAMVGGGANAYTDRQVSAARDYAARGIAATAAIVSVTPSAVGKTAIGIGTGHYDGHSAVGMSIAHAPHARVLLSAGVAAANGGKAVLRAGMAFEF